MPPRRAWIAFASYKILLSVCLTSLYVFLKKGRLLYGRYILEAVSLSFAYFILLGALWSTSMHISVFSDRLLFLFVSAIGTELIVFIILKRLQSHVSLNYWHVKRRPAQFHWKIVRNSCFLVTNKFEQYVFVFHYARPAGYTTDLWAHERHNTLPRYILWSFRASAQTVK